MGGRTTMRTLFGSAPRTEVLASGFGWIEGPVFSPDGYLLFSDIPGDVIRLWDDAGGIREWRRPSSMSNGLTYDGAGRLIACEHASSRVSRTESDSTITALASHYDSRELNSPNDVVVRSDGSIYFTDPLCGREAFYGVEREQDLTFQGLYRVDSTGGSLALLADDFEEPNGLCFSPSESLLYVGDSARGHIRVFDVSHDGNILNGRLFFPRLDSHRGLEPDGMKVDIAGNLYVAMADGIWLISPDGEHLGTLPLSERTTNLAWGGSDWGTLYITAGTSLCRIQTETRGALLGYMHA